MACLVFRLRRIFAVFSRYSSGTHNMASGDNGNSGVFPPKSFPLAWPSRPGEFHPEPLTEPCLTVSSHTARATQ
jgi:hypothetical protein